MAKYEITDHELGELRSLQKLIKQHELALVLVSKNSVMVPKAKDWMATEEGVIAVLKQHLDQTVSKIAHQRGITGKVTVDLAQGIIQEVKEA